MSYGERSFYLFFYCVIGLILFSSALVAGANCTCDHEELTHNSKSVTLRYKLGAIAVILVASALGVSLPIVGKNFLALHPESEIFFLIKSFAAGVILSTGFIHILPDAFKDLTNPCLSEKPWRNFPFTGLFAMVGALGSLMIDAYATGYYRRMHFGEAAPSDTTDKENGGAHAGHVHLHSHATHGHAHGSGPPEGLSELDRIRYKVTSQVLEMGIVVHSVIIGLSLGTSQSIDYIKSLMAALCFHQFFEGVGLAGCIVQASFKSASTLCMALFFSLTTPVGIAIGIGLSMSNVYKNNSPTALIIQGLLNSVAAGILIYMALVDLLAQDFMSPKLQTNTRLFFGVNLTLLLGAGFMAVLAYWA
ncbi:zinc transporter 1-like [Chenopodium quinoa]|uniref:Uncharacterized protein n=1 Tax=Chenopodium quinoa TaxID=63459 RepID=A0A803LES1_CHEQI|nr:zinc transporter 1-like [Chenopodium quinoa]